jgi:hypothetical protein
MEIIGTNFSKRKFDTEASDILMLSPKQGIFGTLSKGFSTLNKAIDKGQKYQQQATELYNKGQQLHQQARQVYSQPPQQYPQQPQVYSQPPQQYPQQIPQPVQSITTHKKLHSSIVRKRCS